MRLRKRLVLSAAGVALATMTPLTLTVVTGTPASLAATSGASAGARLTLHKLGTTHFAAAAPASGEVRPAEGEDAGTADKAVVNRSPRSHAKPTRGTPPPSGVTGTSLSVSQPGDIGWRGINHREQRLADGGNQWSVTPPDQGLCASSSWVMEMVNVAFTVYHTDGTQVGGVQALNPFFGFSHEVLRNPDGTIDASPHQLGDPSCVYDQGTGRFFVTVLDLISDSSGTPTGPSYLDIAVSNTSDPTGGWTTYQLDTTDDGTDQTPLHPDCPCFADYPHIGTDATGFYITSNEFPVFADGFDGANIYAMSKAELTTGAASPRVLQWNTRRADDGLDGYTLAPALAADGNYATANNGTMYFLSSNAATQTTGTSSTNILLWSLTNTSTLANNATNLALSHVRVNVPKYAIPPLADQKAGPVPLADCLNLPKCSKLVLGQPDKYKESEYALDSGLDAGMMQSAFAHGKVWGALDTAVDVGGVTKAGVAYYIIDPTTHAVTPQTVVVPDNNMTYPALGVTSAGKAVMAVSLLGADYYPSAAYIKFDDAGAVPSTVTVVGAGLGPDDEFGGYRAFPPTRARWGDYGAASVVGTTVWVASEYIAQTCTLSEYMTDTVASPFGSCNKTRTSLANWATHIASVTP